MSDRTEYRCPSCQEPISAGELVEVEQVFCNYCGDFYDEDQFSGGVCPSCGTPEGEDSPEDDI